MKETRLVCDLCTEPRRDAVVTLALNGQKGVAPTLDVCEGHRLKLIRIFNPKKKPGPAPGTRTDQQIEQRIMTFIEKHGSGAPTPISLATGIPRWTIQSAMLKMREAKKLVRDGRGKGATYRKA
jgi:hypothetical protein